MKKKIALLCLGIALTSTSLLADDVAVTVDRGDLAATKNVRIRMYYGAAAVLFSSPDEGSTGTAFTLPIVNDTVGDSDLTVGADIQKDPSVPMTRTSDTYDVVMAPGSFKNNNADGQVLKSFTLSLTGGGATAAISNTVYGAPAAKRGAEKKSR